MAKFKNNPFPGVDVSQYLSWDKVKLPSGEVLYVVPGHPGYTYDPIASNATGDTVFRANPQQRITAEQEAKDRQDAAIKQQMQNQSPTGQLLPVAGATGGIILANQFMKPGAQVAGILDNGGRVVMSDGSVVNNGVNAGSQSLGSAAAQGVQGNTFTGTAPQAVLPTGGEGAPAAPQVVGVNGIAGAPQTSWYMTPGSESTLGTAGSAASTIKGGYDTFKAATGGEGGAGLQQGLGEIGSGVGYYFGGPLGAGIGAAGGNAIGYGIKNNNLKGDLALAAALGPMSAPIIIGRMAGFDPLGSALAHKSIANQQRDRWAGLADQGIAGAAEAYQVSQNLGDLSGKIATGEKKGQKWNLSDALAEIKRDPTQVATFRDVYGNFDTFGNDWNTYDPDTKNRITQALIDQNLYESDHGDVIITDKDKARQIKDQVLAAPKPAGMQIPVAPVVNPPNRLSMAAAAGTDNRVIRRR